MNAAMTLILACLGIFGFFILLFGFLLLFRYINYREKIKLAEKGIYPQETPKTKPKKGLLIAGWIISIIGFLSTIIFWLFGISFTESGMGNNFPLGLGPWVLLGLFPFLLGLILLLVYVIKAPSNREYHNGNDNLSAMEKIDPLENNLMSEELGEQKSLD